jgi:hypothetical protein
MILHLRKKGQYCFVTLQHDQTVIDFGLLDHEEAKTVLQCFKNAVDDLEWFVHATEKE